MWEQSLGGMCAWRTATMVVGSSADVTDFVKRGRNRFELKLVTSLFNLLGPHHHAGGELHGVSPGTFSDLHNWVEPYYLVRLGPKGARVKFVRA